MRVATFNVENLDETGVPSLDLRIKALKPQFERLNADILCLQEVHGQERDNQPRKLLALEQLIAGTQYEHFDLVHTKTQAGEAYDERNLVIISRYPVAATEQYRNSLIPKLQYLRITAEPPEINPTQINWERPTFYAKINHPDGDLHVITVHLKSRIPVSIPGQAEGYGYKTVQGWAEGYFLSSMKRVGQALETRFLVDRILDVDINARILVCGDFNAEPGQVPVEAIVGSVENTSNAKLVDRQLWPCSLSIPDNARFTHLHHGQKNLLDHMLMSRPMVARYKGAEIHNEMLRDESLAFYMDDKFPESDHAPFVVEFNM
jgi:endonuclease/exonuclease/phosphatase family metal-dependent hydrolase